MSSLKDRQSARRHVTPRITAVRIDIDDQHGARNTIVVRDLNATVFHLQRSQLLAAMQNLNVTVGNA
jgi:hypothetical protein